LARFSEEAEEKAWYFALKFMHFGPDEVFAEHRRRARFSSWRAARNRKSEDKVAKSVGREISIGGENNQRSIIPVRSDISRFSRGTVTNFAEELFHAGGWRRASYTISED